jgi:hypothetical protein
MFILSPKGGLCNQLQSIVKCMLLGLKYSRNIYIDKFQRFYKSNIPIVKVDGPLFVDPFHYQGSAPFHLHEYSAYKIGKEILKELRKINTRPLIQEASNVG